MKTFYIGAIAILILATGGWWYVHTIKTPVTEMAPNVEDLSTSQAVANKSSSSKAPILTLDGRTLRGTAPGFDRAYILIQGLKDTSTEGRESQLLAYVMPNNTWNISVGSVLPAGKYKITTSGMRPGEATANELEEKIYTLGTVEEKTLYLDKARGEDLIQISAHTNIAGSLLKGWSIMSTVSGKKFALKDVSGFTIGPGEWSIFVHTAKDPDYSDRALEGEIHMYFNESQTAWGDKHDTIQLLDSKGQVVDTVLY